MVDIDKIDTIVNESISFNDIEELDFDELALLLDFIKEETENEAVYMDHVIDMIAYKTTIRDYLPDFDLNDAETFVQYFADRDYIHQWKKDMEMDYRIQWSTDKSPEDISLEVLDKNRDEVSFGKTRQ